MKLDTLLDTLISQLPASLVLQLAQIVARTQPLKPNPGWYFSVAESNPSAIIRLRRAIWRYCNRKRLQKPIIMTWYDGLKVHVYLGNDMSRMLFIGGCMEPNEFFFLSKVLSRGMIFIDVGANDGSYSLFAARRVGPEGTALAWEPSQREFVRLQANLQLNRLTNVRPLQIALSNRSGHAILRVAGYEHEGQNTLGDFFVHNDIECSHTEQVILKRLDDLADEEGLKQVDVIKIDVEGAELSVIEGAQRTLTKFHPLLLLELLDAALRYQGSSAEEVLALLKSLGYEIYTFDKASGKPVKARQHSELSDNIIAAHPSRTWRGLNDDE